MHPMEVIPMGYTELPEEIILGFIEENSYRFTSETYDLLSHNCNNFSEEFVNFLTGNHIPDKILNLPTVLLPLLLLFPDSPQHSSRPIRSSLPPANGHHASDSPLPVLSVRSVCSVRTIRSSFSHFSICDGLAAYLPYAQRQTVCAHAAHRHARKHASARLEPRGTGAAGLPSAAIFCENRLENGTGGK